MGKEGVEPSRPFGHTDLNRARLPFRHFPWRRHAQQVVATRSAPTHADGRMPCSPSRDRVKRTERRMTPPQAPTRIPRPSGCPVTLPSRRARLGPRAVETSTSRTGLIRRTTRLRRAACELRGRRPDTIMSSEPEEEPVSVLQRFEKRLEGLVEGAFAKVFKGVVHPVEILNAMQREAEAHKAILAGGRTLVPNRYVIDLSPYDHSRLAPYAAALAQELAQSQAEFIGEQALDGLRRRDRRDRARRGAGHRHVPGHRRGLHRRRRRPGLRRPATTPARPRYPRVRPGRRLRPAARARRRPQRPAGLRRRTHLPAARSARR